MFLHIKMVSITLSVSDEIRETMKKFPEINWSGLVRTCITEKAKTLTLKEELLNDLSKEKDFNKYNNECLKKSGLSNKDFNKRKDEIFSRINFIEFNEYKEFIQEALEGLIDEDDAPYIALSLKIKAPVWSNDKDLKKQEKVTILSTEDLMNILF